MGRARRPALSRRSGRAAAATPGIPTLCSCFSTAHHTVFIVQMVRPPKAPPKSSHTHREGRARRSGERGDGPAQGGGRKSPGPPIRAGSSEAGDRGFQTGAQPCPVSACFHGNVENEGGHPPWQGLSGDPPATSPRAEPGACRGQRGVGNLCGPHRGFSPATRGPQLCSRRLPWGGGLRTPTPCAPFSSMSFFCSRPRNLRVLKEAFCCNLFSHSNLALASKYQIIFV